MSAEATAWVWRHSPHRGVTFAVHLALADSANEQHDWELWTTQATLARKARTSRGSLQRAIGALIDAGHLVLVEEGVGRANRYRLVLPDAPVVFDTRPRGRGVPHHEAGVTAGNVPHHEAPGASPRGRGVPHHEAGGASPRGTITKKNSRGNSKEPGLARGRAVASAVWDALDPKPATPFVAAAKIAETLIDAGWEAEAVTAAMIAAPTISTRAVEMQLRQTAGSRSVRRRQVLDDDRDATEGRLAL